MQAHSEDIPGLENLIKFISQYVSNDNSEHSHVLYDGSKFKVSNVDIKDYSDGHLELENIKAYLDTEELPNSSGSQRSSNLDEVISIQFETDDQLNLTTPQCKTVDVATLEESTCPEISTVNKLAVSPVAAHESQNIQNESHNTKECIKLHDIEVASEKRAETGCIPCFVSIEKLPISKIKEANLIVSKVASCEGTSVKAQTTGVAGNQLLDNQNETASVTVLPTCSSEVMDTVEPSSDVAEFQTKHDLSNSAFDPVENNDLNHLLNYSSDKLQPLQKFNICEELQSSIVFPSLSSPPSIGKKKRYKLSLDNILLDRAKKEKEKSKEYITSLESIESDNDDVPAGMSFHLLEHKSNRIIQPPPGLNIFKTEKYFSYFSLNNLDLNSCGFSKKSAKLWEKKLLQFPATSLPRIISNMPTMILSHLSNKNAIMLFIFKFIAVHEDISCAYLCIKTIHHFIQMTHSLCKEYAWCPPLEEILVIFINYGVTPSDHCPLKMLLLKSEKKLNIQMNISETIKENSIPVSKNSFSERLNIVLDALTLFIDHWCSYKDSELINIIILLCWVGLDSELIYTVLKKKLSSCISACLQKISDSNWPQMLEKLTCSLAKLGNHHRNVLLVTEQLPAYTSRGLQVKKCVGYMALETFLQVETSQFTSFVTPTEVLSLLQNYQLLSIEDWYLLHTVICLVEICIGNKVQYKFKDVLKKLHSLVMGVYSRISDNVDDPETLEVKQLAFKLGIKWDAIWQCLSEHKVNIAAVGTGSSV